MEKLIAACQRHARWIIVTWCVLAAISGVAASNLRLNSDLERLLPEDARSVRNLASLEQAYGQQLDRMTLLVEGDSPEKNLETVQQLATELASVPHVIGVEYRRPTEFFTAHRLMYMDLVDAETIAEKLGKRLKWERKRANPLFVSVGDDTPPEIDFSDIEQKYADQVGAEEYLANPDRTGFVLTLEMDYPSDQIDTTAELVSQELVPRVQKLTPQGVSVTYTGRYIKRLEQRDATARDLGRGTSLAFVIILVFLVAYFRSLRPPVIVTIPLVLGTLCTFGATWLAFSTLNILTGFVGSVLLGLGIDYGIHLAARYRHERVTREVKEALVASFSSSGKASLYAGLTTLAALGSLAVSSFQAFYEFGLLALIGMTLVGLAYATLFPALIFALEGTALALRPARDEAEHVEPWQPSRFRMLRHISLAALFLSLACAVWGWRHLAFEWDFHELMPADLPAHVADRRLEELGVGRVPGVILVEDRAHAEAVAAELAKRKESGGTGEMIDRSLTVYDLLPTQQEEKLTVWRTLREEFDKIPKKVLDKQPDLAELKGEVEQITDEGEVTLEALPKELTRRFARRDDPSKWIMLVFPKRIIHDARDAIAYSDATTDLPGSSEGGSVDAIGEEAIMRDIVNDLEKDTVWMLILTLLSILAVAVVAFRDVKRVVLVFGTIGIGFFVAMGLAGVFAIKFNFINIIILPIWLGLGVDAAFHMMTRVAEDPRDASGFWHTVRAVAAAFGTTMIGFGALMISAHRGLASLGEIAVVGLGAIFVLSVGIQLLALRRRDALGETPQQPS